MCDKRNLFCYVCGLLVDKRHRSKLINNQAVVEAFKVYFNRTYVKSFWYEPEFICSRCSAALKKREPLRFSAPVIWHHQFFHKSEECYFCQTYVVGHSYKTRDRVQYANVSTVSLPVLKKFKGAESDTTEEDISSICSNEIPCMLETENAFLPQGKPPSERHLITNNEYRDLVRDLGLSSRQSETLASRLKQWNAVEDNFKCTFGRDCAEKSSFVKMFQHDELDNKLVYCTDVEELFFWLSYEHRPDDWRLFLDGSCKSKYLIYFIC